MTLHTDKTIGAPHFNWFLIDEDAGKYCKQKRHWETKDCANATVVRGTPFLISDAVPRSRPPPRFCPEFLAAWLRWPDWKLQPPLGGPRANCCLNHG